MLEDAQRTRREQLAAAAQSARTEHSERAVLLQWAARTFGEEGSHVARVNVNLWAEALRDKSVAELARSALTNATRIVADVVTRETERDAMTLRSDPKDVANVLVAIQLGLEVQKAVGVKLDAKGVLRVLDELFPSEPKVAKPAVRRRRSKR
jgi:hypothetical protein